jgi:hypothetical protein
LKIDASFGPDDPIILVERQMQGTNSVTSNINQQTGSDELGGILRELVSDKLKENNIKLPNEPVQNDSAAVQLPQGLGGNQSSISALI